MNCRIQHDTCLAEYSTVLGNGTRDYFHHPFGD